MKLTFEIPVGLLREAQAAAAGRALSIDALVVDALRRALPGGGTMPVPSTRTARKNGDTLSRAAAKWSRQWEQLVENIDRDRQSGRTAREILRQSRR